MQGLLWRQKQNNKENGQSKIACLRSKFVESHKLETNPRIPVPAKQSGATR